MLTLKSSNSINFQSQQQQHHKTKRQITKQTITITTQKQSTVMPLQCNATKSNSSELLKPKLLTNTHTHTQFLKLSNKLVQSSSNDLPYPLTINSRSIIN